MNEFFTLREICERGGVTRRMVQRYEQKGLVKPVAVNKYGHLLYDEQGLFQIKRIRLYHQFGFQLDEIKLLFQMPESQLRKKLNEQIEIMENNLEKYKNLILQAKVMVEKMEGND